MMEAWQEMDNQAPSSAIFYVTWEHLFVMSHSEENQAAVGFEPGVRRINYWRDPTVVPPWSSRAATAGYLRLADNEKRAVTSGGHTAEVGCNVGDGDTQHPAGDTDLWCHSAASD